MTRNAPHWADWRWSHSFAGAVQVADATATFTVPSQPLAFGEHLRLVGSAERLGAWDPAAGLALEWAEGDNWSADAALPEGAIDFKVPPSLISD